MEKDKQRNQKTRRRERAQRMQAEKRQIKSKDCDSAEDELPLKEKPKRPPPSRRKKVGQSRANGIGAANGLKESLHEEDIIDEFAIFSFTSYDDLEDQEKLSELIDNALKEQSDNETLIRDCRLRIDKYHGKIIRLEEEIADTRTITSKFGEFVNYVEEIRKKKALEEADERTKQNKAEQERIRKANSLKQLKCGQVTLGLPCDGSKLGAKSSDSNSVLNNHVPRSTSSPQPQPSPLRNNSIPSPLSDHSKKNSVVGSNKNACEISSTIAPPSNGSKTPTPSTIPSAAAASTEESVCVRNAENLREKPILQQTSSPPLRDQRASSHERLSDISSRCSSGKGYMCDSEGDEGDDDKGSDGDLFPSPPSSCKRELPRSGIPNHLSNNLLNGTNGDVPKERSSPSVLAPSSKPQIRVVTPPRYSPKSMQPLQPIPPQPPPTSLPYSSQLTALSSNSAHHSVSGPPAALVDQHNVPVSLQHHYTPPTSQPQPPTSFPQHSLPLTHPQYSSTSTLYPPVLNGGLTAVPPQAHSGGHPTHTSHPIYPAHAPHHLMGATSSPLPAALSSASAPSQPPVVAYVSAGSAAGNQPASYSTPPQLCPLQLSVTSSYAPPTAPQPPAAHSANAYIPPYTSPSQPALPGHPYSSPSALQPASQPPSAYPPAHLSASPHVANSHHPSGGSVIHGIPNSHHSHQHHPHLQPHPQQLAPPSSAAAAHHLGAAGHPQPMGASPSAAQQLAPASAPHSQISSGYNHLASIAPTYAPLAASGHGRSTASNVTSDASTVVVAAPSSYAIPPHTSNSFSALYAPYSNTPYLSSHSRASRSPLPVISAKSTVSNVSASNTTSNMSIPSSATAMASVATTTVTTSHRDYATAPLVNRSHSPRGHSPTRERDSFSSSVSSLSRGSVHTPISNPSPFSMPPVPVPAPPAHATLPAGLPGPPSVPVSSSLNLSNKPSIWGSVGAVPATPTAAVPPITRPSSHNSFAPPLFTSATTATAAHATVPPSAAAATAVPTLHSTPTHPANPFSAESLSQSYEADLLRRELDSRFLASQDRSSVAAAAAGIPAPYLRTEMHHHQHQHTHVHQHTASLLPPPPTAALYPPPALFKDIPKLGGVDSPFYRQAMGIPNYPGYPSTLLHPTLGAATPFAPPTHLPTFTPKQVVDPTKPKPVKTGKWNAMHVRIAWEIYHHQQQKQQAADIKPSKSELLTRTPSHLFPAPARTPHELSPFSTPHRPPGTAFEAHAHPAASPYAALGNNVFSRYPPAPFPSLSQYPPGLHESWARLNTRAVPGLPGAPYPPTLAPPWNIKPEPGEVDREREQREREQRERERERERAEREREREREKERERSKERERMRREEKQRRHLAQQQAAQQVAQQQQAAAAAAQQQLSQHVQHQHHAQSAQQAQQAAAKSVIRDRSPLRDTPSGISQKEEELLMLGRGPPTYLRQAPRALPPAPQFAHWEHYSYDPFGYHNPLMAAALREEDQRAKFFAGYPSALPPGAHLRKDPSPSGLHVRQDLQMKKEDSSQSR